MKITRAQLKQIIKEELTADQLRARNSPMFAALSSAPDTAARDKADAVLSNIRMEYNSLGSNEEMALFEERLVAGVNEVVAAWQAERGQEGY
jgi:uncharacterized protein YbjQ (UPF0145 family)